MPRTTSEEFNTAAKEVNELKTKPSDNELLELYGLYKVATQEKEFETTPKPGMFDLKGKAKYNAWKKLVDEGVTPEDAEKSYIELVKKLQAKQA